MWVGRLEETCFHDYRMGVKPAERWAVIRCRCIFPAPTWYGQIIQRNALKLRRQLRHPVFVAWHVSFPSALPWKHCGLNSTKNLKIKRSSSSAKSALNFPPVQQFAATEQIPIKKKSTEMKTLAEQAHPAQLPADYQPPLCSLFCGSQKRSENWQCQPWKARMTYNAVGQVFVTRKHVLRTNLKIQLTWMTEKESVELIFLIPSVLVQ